MRKKIIILYSTAGMGHKKAAIALYKVFQERGVDAEIIDVMEYASRIYKFLYLNFYVFLMTHAKWLWGALYYFSNSRIFDVLTRKIRAILDYNSLPGLGKMLIEKSPDAVVATHFLLPSIASVLKKNKNLRAKLYAVVTDYGPHTYWLSDYMDKFFVGSESVADLMKERWVPLEKINVTGIPTMEEFLKEFDEASLRKTYGLEEGKKTVFLMSGGFGVGPIAEMLLSLNDCKVDIQVITVCGHNKPMYQNIELLKQKLKYSVILFGFTDKVAELMAISDLMITKAGGISVTEALNSRLPMVLFASVPGQETWNENLLVKMNAAEKAKKISDIPIIANRVLLSQDAYDSMKAGIDSLRKPEAVHEIVDIVLKEVD